MNYSYFLSKPLTVPDVINYKKKPEKKINSKQNEENNEQNTLYKLSNKCLFITSKYFDSLEDHINFTKVSKRMKGNMEKFYYNPISVNEQTISLFPNIQTLHCYDKNDNYIEKEKIYQYVDWRPISNQNVSSI